MSKALLMAVLTTAACAQAPRPAPIAPRIPDTILRIQGIENNRAVVKNTGSRTVTGWAVQITGPEGSPHYSDIVSVDRSLGSPLVSGAVDSVSTPAPDDIVPQDWASEMRIVVVFFDDGTHMGHAQNRAYGGDVVSQILEQRLGRAQAWAHWQSLIAHLPANDQDALQQFIEATADAPQIRAVVGEKHIAVNTTFAQSAANFVSAAARHQAEQMKAALDAGQSANWVRNNLLAAFASRVNMAATVSKTAAADNGEAQ